MNKNESQILCLLFSEFVKLSALEGYDDCQISAWGDCFILDSWHKDDPLIKVCVVPKSDLSGLRNPYAYIKENTCTRREDGN